MNKLEYIINQETKELIKVQKEFLIKKNFIKKFIKLTSILEKAISNGNKIIFFGNGGSAADSMHLAAELVVKYKKKRKPLAAIALSANTANITAIGNDFNFKYIFSRQLEALAQKGDVAFAISTSGNSDNIIEAIKYANKNGLMSVVFSGNNGGKLKKFSKNILLIPSKKTSIIQIYHLFFGQIICDYLESRTK